MRPPPPSLHTNFFSSLKQVEKRLKLEHPSQPPTLSSPQPPPPPPPHQQRNLPPPPPSPPPPPVESNYTSTESLSTPIYLHLEQPTNSSSGSILQDSEPPHEFLSNSPVFPPTQEDPPQPNDEQDPQSMNQVDKDGIDDIELLIQLLRLSDCKEGEQQWVGLGLKKDGGACGCDEEFLAKIVGRKGPKCEKEVERLEGWIKHFLNDGGEEKIEPLRLAHLLLGKVAFVSEGSDDFGGFEFPSTIEEFLQNDPPEE